MILQGVPVCPGCTLAPSYLLAEPPAFDLHQRATEPVDSTLARIDAALQTIAAELTAAREQYAVAGAAEQADLMDVQMAMLDDSFFRDQITAAAQAGLSVTISPACAR